MKSVAILKKFFEAEPHGRKLTMDELRGLNSDERRELAALAAVELDVELDAQ